MTQKLTNEECLIHEPSFVDEKPPQYFPIITECRSLGGLKHTPPVYINLPFAPSPQYILARNAHERLLITIVEAHLPLETAVIHKLM